MQIKLRYFAQVRTAAGAAEESMELPAGATVELAIKAAAELHGEAFTKIAIATDGRVRPSLLLMVNEQAPEAGHATPLVDGDTVSVFSPVAGG